MGGGDEGTRWQEILEGGKRMVWLVFFHNYIFIEFRGKLTMQIEELEAIVTSSVKRKYNLQGHYKIVCYRIDNISQK